MTARAWELAWWSVAVLAAAVAVGSALGSRVDHRAWHAQPIPPAVPPPRTFDSQSLAAATTTIIGSNPFRLDRQPARVGFGAEPVSTEAQGAPTPPERPTLSITGIIGGPPWQAIIEGVPGRDGAVLVRSGEVLGELRVRTIRPDTVVVEGPDTVWTLTLKRPWQ